MARTYDTQPMVKSPDTLTIGTMKIMANEVNPDTKFLIDEATGTDTAVSADTNTAPSALASESLGALQNAGFEAQPEFIEHQAGYPKNTDVKITTSSSCNWSADMEELISQKGLRLLRKIVDGLNTGQTSYYSVLGYAQQVEGALLGFYTPIAQLKPELNLSLSNEWGALPVKFEAVYRDNFTYNELLYPQRDTSILERSTAYQPITVDKNGLVIGKMQIRVGKFARRNSGTAQVFPVRKVVGAVETTPAVVLGASATYTGTLDGGYVIEIVDGGVPDGVASGSFKVLLLDGTETATAWIPTDGSEVAIGADGVTVVFSATHSYTAGDKYVVGVETGSALDADETTIICPYPYLPSTYSVGALASTEVSTNITYKDHFSGFPEKKTLSILESSEVTFNFAIEEMALSATPPTTGFATSVPDATLDAATTGAGYFAPVEVVITGVFGRTLSFWIPNAQLVPSANFSPSDDWANFQVGFLASKKAGVNMFDFITRGL